MDERDAMFQDAFEVLSNQVALNRPLSETEKEEVLKIEDRLKGEAFLIQQNQSCEEAIKKIRAKQQNLRDNFREITGTNNLTPEQKQGQQMLKTLIMDYQKQYPYNQPQGSLITDHLQNQVKSFEVSSSAPSVHRRELNKYFGTSEFSFNYFVEADDIEPMNVELLLAEEQATKPAAEVKSKFTTSNFNNSMINMSPVKLDQKPNLGELELARRQYEAALRTSTESIDAIALEGNLSNQNSLVSNTESEYPNQNVMDQRMEQKYFKREACENLSEDYKDFSHFSKAASGYYMKSNKTNSPMQSYRSSSGELQNIIPDFRNINFLANPTLGFNGLTPEFASSSFRHSLSDFRNNVGYMQNSVSNFGSSTPKVNLAASRPELRYSLPDFRVPTSELLPENNYPSFGLRNSISDLASPNLQNPAYNYSSFSGFQSPTFDFGGSNSFTSTLQNPYLDPRTTITNARLPQNDFKNLPRDIQQQELSLQEFAQDGKLDFNRFNAAVGNPFYNSDNTRITKRKRPYRRQMKNVNKSE